jgi:hypothetical protein
MAAGSASVGGSEGRDEDDVDRPGSPPREHARGGSEEYDGMARKAESDGKESDDNDGRRVVVLVGLAPPPTADDGDGDVVGGGGGEPDVAARNAVRSVEENVVIRLSGSDIREGSLASAGTGAVDGEGGVV